MGDPGDTANSDSGTTPGWYPDPRARFEVRYHNGRSWTADVATGGERFVDPLGTRPAPSTGTPAAAGARPPSGDAGRRNPVATASMVLGIVAICIGWMPFVVVLGIIAGVLAIAFGLAGRRRAAAGADGAGFALAGLITGVAALLVCVGGVLFSVSLLRAVDRYENPVEHEAEITSCIADGDQLTAAGTLTNLGATTESFTVRVFFVRPGTDNARRQAVVALPDVGADETREFEVTRPVGDIELDCIVGAVRGPLPYGVDPGT